MSKVLNLGNIPVLQGRSNYREWSLEVRATAQLGGFWKAIAGTNTTTSPDEEVRDKYEQREQKATGLIMKTVSGVLKVELHELTITTTTSPATTREPTSQEMWNHLKAKFEKNDGISAILDLRFLSQTKLVDDGTLETQLNHLQDIRSRCALNDIKFEDWRYAALILLALPDTYKHITDSFLATGPAEDLKPTDVRTKILETEIRRNSDATSSHANLISARSSAKSRKSPPGACHHCGERGHWANRCPAKPKPSMPPPPPHRTTQGKVN
jgi:hypothetical protein